jgi:hypothetical protein
LVPLAQPQTSTHQHLIQTRELLRIAEHPLDAAIIGLPRNPPSSPTWP